MTKTTVSVYGRGASPADQIDLARQVAKIAGSSSAAAAAVRRYDEIRASGAATEILLVAGRWLVKEPAKYA